MSSATTLTYNSTVYQLLPTLIFLLMYRPEKGWFGQPDYRTHLHFQKLRCIDLCYAYESSQRNSNIKNTEVNDRNKTSLRFKRIVIKSANSRLTSKEKKMLAFITRSSHHLYSIFLSRVKMNSINWPAPNIWVFIAQLVEHCSANAEAMGSNPVEALKFFSGLNLQLLKLRL